MYTTSIKVQLATAKKRNFLKLVYVNYAKMQLLKPPKLASEEILLLDEVIKNLLKKITIATRLGTHNTYVLDFMASLNSYA